MRVRCCRSGAGYLRSREVVGRVRRARLMNYSTADKPPRGISRGSLSRSLRSGRAARRGKARVAPASGRDARQPPPSCLAVLFGGVARGCPPCPWFSVSGVLVVVALLLVCLVVWLVGVCLVARWLWWRVVCRPLRSRARRRARSVPVPRWPWSSLRCLCLRCASPPRACRCRWPRFSRFLVCGGCAVRAAGGRPFRWPVPRCWCWAVRLWWWVAPWRWPWVGPPP
jgi:hypothetical protein